MTVHFKADSAQKNRGLIDSIKETLVDENNSIKEKERHLAYNSNLPEGYTPESVRKIKKYDADFVTACHVAVGEKAAELFLANKDYQTVEASIGFSDKNDSIDISVARSKTFQNQWAEKPEDKEVEKFLCMKTDVTIASAKGHGVKAVREAMSKEFEGMFKK